ncbi:hypothetical protein [uncultured Treponema sp.]|uniref:hypothetical protein n=1 Tax=uncultured Treponema sp. TaxID=162155 RepID=UPI0025E19487|nr:hypothetical protein [uncultured Treponema sp.]
MYSFLILSIPAAVIFYCCIHTEYSFKSFFAPIAIGLTAGIASAIFKEYFIFSAYVATSGFFEHFLHILKTTIFPPVILFALWDFFSKDDTEYKATSAFPLLASFYAIFLPYISISSPEKHSFFFLFENTILFICTAFFAQALYLKIKLSIKSKQKNKTAVFATAFVVISSVLPAIQTLWYFKIFGFAHIVLAAIFIAATFIFHKITFSKENSLDTVL